MYEGGRWLAVLTQELPPDAGGGDIHPKNTAAVTTTTATANRFTSSPLGHRVCLSGCDRRGRRGLRIFWTEDAEDMPAASAS